MVISTLKVENVGSIPINYKMKKVNKLKEVKIFLKKRIKVWANDFTTVSESGSNECFSISKPFYKHIYIDLDKESTQQLIEKNSKSKNGGLYILLHLGLNDNNLQKFYIGSALNNFFYRFNSHVTMNSKTGNINAQNAVKKYGLTNFAFIELTHFPIKIKGEKDPNYQILLTQEMELQYKFDFKELYNSKLSDKLFNVIYSAESKVKMSNAKLGVPMSEKTKAKIKKTISQKEFFYTPEYRHEMASLQGFKVSLYSKDEKLIGKYPSIRNLAKVHGIAKETARRSYYNGTLLKTKNGSVLGYIKPTIV